LGAFPKGLGPCDSQDKILGITIPLFFLSEGEERRGEGENLDIHFAIRIAY
jgi:hypothetical protein